MLALPLVVLSVLAASPKKAPTLKMEPGKRELVRRTITITDETREVEIHVVAGGATTLRFPTKLGKHALVDAKGYFPADKQGKADRLFILLPDKDIPAGELVTLQLSLDDGTLLPPFLLVTQPASADLYVEVDVQLNKRAAADSAVALKTQVAELQSKLDECESAGGERGAIKVAELVLRQDWSKPVAFVVEQHPTRHLDKQSALLVQTRHVYRLFDATYVVLTVENRDPEKRWILDRAEVAVEDGSSNEQARVLDVALDLSQGVPSGEEARVVVAFKTPTSQSVDHRYTLRLFEKAGNRHVKLEGLKL